MTAREQANTSLAPQHHSRGFLYGSDFARCRGRCCCCCCRGCLWRWPLCRATAKRRNNTILAYLKQSSPISLAPLCCAFLSLRVCFLYVCMRARSPKLWHSRSLKRALLLDNIYIQSGNNNCAAIIARRRMHTLLVCGPKNRPASKGGQLKTKPQSRAPNFLGAARLR